MQLHRYTSADQSPWDEFVRTSRNGTFLFERAYMDYHSDRFHDHSLMYYDAKGRLLALLPANEVTHTGDYYSHQGLTYGGLVLGRHTHATDVAGILSVTIEYLRNLGFSRWHYKPVPTIYHLLPCEEEEYFLWRKGAQLEVCNLATTIDMRASDPIVVEQRRKRGAAKALRLGYQWEETDDISLFWPIVEHNLWVTYEARPVHSLDEISLLKRRFPEQMRCFVARDAHGVIQGGIVVQQSQQVVHSQYPHATEIGKRDGVMDMLFLQLMEYYRMHHPAIRYFDFGTSNEQGGRILNESLIAQKEGFGGRGIAYKTYLINL